MGTSFVAHRTWRGAPLGVGPLRPFSTTLPTLDKARRYVHENARARITASLRSRGRLQQLWNASRPRTSDRRRERRAGGRHQLLRHGRHLRRDEVRGLSSAWPSGRARRGRSSRPSSACPSTTPTSARCPNYVRLACEESLRSPQHRPHRPLPTALPRRHRPTRRDARAHLHELVAAGKVREIGCSNLNVPQLREAAEPWPETDQAFVSVQNQYSLLDRDPRTRRRASRVRRTRSRLLTVLPLG
jgi:hypothetical protein